MKRMKFAHVEGHTDLVYSEDGSKIITCGADGDYRVWNGYEDDDPECVRVGDEATCISFKKNKIYVGTDMQVLQIYSHPDNLTDGIVSRFTAIITHIAFNKDGSKIASGSSDMTLKVNDLAGPNKGKELNIDGHSAPILSVSLDPKSEFLASSSCDGTVRIWSLQQSGKQVQSWTWAPKSNDFCNSPSLCRLQFEPTTGQFLAIPCFTTSSVKILERNTWKEVAELKHERLQDISICCWSPCGKYLAASSKAGDVLIWDVKAKSLLNSFQHEKKAQICNMQWNPSPTSKGEIAFCDSRGYFGLLENVTSSTTAAVTTASAAHEALGMDEDVDDNDISISQIKKNTGFVTSEENGHDVFTGLDFLNDDVMSKASSRPGSPLTGTSKRLHFPSSKRQEPFQPGSSPAHLQHRYMMWNNVGIVRSFAEEGSSIEVEFHDSSVHHGLHIPNTLGHTLATLSTQALLLACPTSDECGSKLVCVNFAGWDGHKEWSTTLPQGEEALALAVGDSWLAVATSRRLLRFYTISGLQRGLISLPGPVVCLAGHGNKLFIAFHLAMGFPGEQSLGYGVVAVDKRSPVDYDWISIPQPLPLGPDCDLSWAGFTDEGTPVTLDSSGLMQLQSRRNMWIPLLDTRQNVKGKSDHYFIIGLSELEKNVRCVLCKGARYPATLPRPNISLLDVKLPLCDLGNEKTQFEEALIQSTMQLQLAARLDQSGFDVEESRNRVEKSCKESLMKMFALACQSEREVRAVDVAEWMNTEQMLQLAVKYATRARKRQLANRLTEMAQQLVAREQEQEEELPSFMMTQESEASDRDMFACTPPVLEVEDNPILQAKQRSMAGAAENAVNRSMIRPISQNKKNPFVKKGSDSSVAATPSPRGMAIFDVPKVTPSGPTKENVTKSKTTKQPTLFSSLASKKTPAPDGASVEPPTQPGKSGFMLWFDENKSTLQLDNPEASDSELVRLAAQKFKSLPQDEKQKYMASKRKSSDSIETTEGAKKNRPTLAEKLSTFEARK